jgi:hypothetical protein
MRTRQYQDSHIYIALALAVAAALVSTSRSFALDPGTTFSPATVFGEAVPWDTDTNLPDLTVPP